MKTVGIDIGTTTISGVVMDTEERRAVTSQTVQNGSFICTGNEWERIQDTAVICEKAGALLDALLERYPDIQCIGLTGQMHGILYIDQEGKSVSPLYTWQDQRGELPEFEGESAVSWIKKKLGLPVAAGYGLVTHFYHCKRGQVPAGSASFCTIADYFGMVLTDRKTPLVHSSNAASMGFFDKEKGEFAVESLRKAGIDTGILPKVSHNVELLGKYKGIPVTIALGDNQASFLGAVGMKKNVWLLNVGTGGQISVISDEYFEGNGIEARPFLDGKYLLVGATLCAGRAYAVLEKFFRQYAAALEAGGQEQYSIMAKILEDESEQRDRLHVRTTFKGTRSEPEVRGSISNISEDNFTPGGLIRGVLEGIAHELYAMYTVIHDGAGIPAEYLVGSGNGVRKNEVLQHIFSRVFERELILSPSEEEAACGAALLSLYEGGENGCNERRTRDCLSSNIG